MTKRPNPPKAWAARPAITGPPRPSGLSQGALVFHPDEFKRLVGQGVIDKHGHWLNRKDQS